MVNLFRKKSIDDFNNTVSQTNLKKGLTSFDIAAMGVGSVIGTGIFVATGQGAHMAGPAVTLSYVIAAITAVLCALTYAELATMFPISGSTYSYCYIAFGEIIAWILAWNLILEYLVVAATIATGWSSTLVGALATYNIHLPEMITKSPLAGGIVDLPAVLIIAFISWILYIGVSESAKVNNIIVATPCRRSTPPWRARPCATWPKACSAWTPRPAGTAMAVCAPRCAAWCGVAMR